MYRYARFRDTGEDVVGYITCLDAERVVDIIHYRYAAGSKDDMFSVRDERLV